MTVLKAAAVLGFGAMFAMTAAPAPEAVAADLSVTPVTKSARVVHHRRARVVRDYDGTAVIERRVRIVQRLPDGTLATDLADRDDPVDARHPAHLPQRPAGAAERHAPPAAGGGDAVSVSAELRRQCLAVMRAKAGIQ